MAFLLYGVAHAATEEQRLNCYSSAVIEIWGGSDNIKNPNLSFRQINDNLIASGAITYNYEMDTIRSVKKLETPAALLGLRSEAQDISSKQIVKLSQAISVSNISTEYINKRIKNGLYKEIRDLESCQDVF